MSLIAHMGHRCSTTRQPASPDEYNHEQADHEPNLTGVLCRLVTKSQRNPLGPFAENPYVTGYLLLVPAGTDIDEGDQVVDVVYEDGTVEAGPFRVKTILPRRARTVRHISIQLERVS